MAKPSVAEIYHLTPHDHVVGNSPLHSACYSGKLDIVKLLILEQSSNVNGENHQGNTPLGLACKAGHKDVVSFLLRLSTCDLNHRNKAGNTLLHIACLEGDFDIVSLLCSERDCIVDTRNRYGDTPLGLACNSGNSDFVEFLVNQKDCNIATQNRDGNSPLHLTCHSGYLGIVRFLTNLPYCDVNSTNKDGDTPLHLGCQSGWLDIVNYLTTEKCSDLNYQNLNGNTPLYTAIVSHQKDVAMFICKLEHCDITHPNKEGDNALHLASSEGWSAMIDLLVSVRRCDINSRNNQGNTPMHIASLKGHKAVVKILIQQPSCVIICVNQHGNTPLSLACQNGWEDIVKLLINVKHCNLNHKNKSGIAPTHLACYNRHQRIVEILIRDKRCDVECEDMNENTPLGLVCHLGWTDTVKYLLTKRQSRVGSKNKYGDTPLHLACSGGYLKVVKLLVAQKDCDINCRNSRGDTPFILACQSSLEVVRFLSTQKGCQREGKSFIQNNGGNAPLHHACAQSRLDIVKFLVNDLKHDVNCENNDGNTPLSLSFICETRWQNLDIVRFFVSLPQCRINHQNKAGDTPLHIACREGLTDAVALLSGIQHCNFNLPNKCGQTAAQVAVDLNHTDILQLMLQEPHHIPSVLASVSQDQWTSIINVLSRGRELTLPSHFQSKLDAVKFVVQHKLWDPKCPNEDGSIALHFASSDLMEYLVHEQGCDVNHQNHGGNIPLHAACLISDLDAVGALINVKHCNLNHKNKFGITPIHLACYNRHQRIVEILIRDKRCDVECEDMNQNTPLGLVCRLGWTDTVKYLLTKRQSRVGSKNKYGDTPLHLACSGGCLKVIKLLIVQGNCNVKCRNSRGDTPFILACQSCLEVVRFLSAQKECETFVRNSDGASPLHHACAHRRMDIVKFLVKDLKHDVNCENDDGNTPLSLSIICETRWKNLDIVRFFVSLPQCRINHQNKAGNTPLHIACREGYTDAVILLSGIQHCNFNLPNKCGQTAAQVAVDLNRTDILQLMFQEPHHIPSVLASVSQDQWTSIINVLSRGRELTLPSHFQSKLDAVKFVVQHKLWDPKCPNEDGSIALHFASSDLMEYLVHEQGCDVNHQNERGNTPLHLACLRGDMNVVKALTSIEIYNINLQNTAGDTPLHIACREGLTDAVALLSGIQHCNFNLPNKCGQTAAQVAVDLNHTDILQLMLQEPHHIPSVLASVSQDQWTSIINVLSRGRELTLPSHFQSKLDAVKFVVQHKLWDPKCPNQDGSIALHFASSDLMEYLVHEQGCDVNHQNHGGNTPLHAACLISDLDAVGALINVKHCNLNHKNKSGIAPIHLACYNRHQRIVEIIIRDKRCDVECEDMNENTPLGLVCHLGWTDTVKYLLTKRQSRVGSKNKYGDTPLHLACSGGYLKVIKLLIVQGNCNVKCRNSRGDTPFILACQSSLEIVRFLSTQKGCQREGKSFIQNSDGASPLHHACAHSRMDIVKFLVNDLKHDVNCENDDGNTPLSLSIICETRWKNLDIVRFFVSLPQCRINHQNKAGDTPLHIACREGYTDAVILLSGIQHCNFNLPNKCGQTVAQVAVDLNRTDILQLMLQEPHHIPSVLASVSQDQWASIINVLSRGRELTLPSHFQSKLDAVKFVVQHKLWDPKCPNQDGSIALHFASSDLMEYLVHEQGCDVNHQNHGGNTPLHAACLISDLDAVGALINVKHCNLNHKNKSGIAPIHLACYNRHQRIVEIIIRDKRCDVECEDVNENTPLGLVCHLGWTDTVKYLLTKRQSRVGSKNKYGDTPLHLACSGGRLKVVKLLIVQGNCNVKCRNSQGDTPFILACQSSLEIVRFLSAQKECETFVQNSDGASPLHRACAHSRLDIVKFLVNELKHDVNCENNDGNTPLSLILACSSSPGWRNCNTVKFFVSLPQCDINHQNKAGNTPLHIACREGLTDAVVLLSGVKHCNFNVLNEHGQTAAQVVVDLNRTDILQLMLQEPHRILTFFASVSQDQWTSIINVLSRGRELTLPSHFQSKLDAVKFVVQHKLWDPKCPNEDGSIALHFASSDLMEYLVHEQGCDVNHQNERGNTPLHLACLRGDMNVVKALTSIEIYNINLQNTAGDTPLHIACREGLTDAVALLSGIEHCNFNLKNKHDQTPTQVVYHTNILQVMPLPSLLASVNQDEWIRIINVLGRGRELTLPSHFQSLLDVVKFVVQHRLWDPKCPNEYGNIALHFASSELVEYLVHEQRCDVNHQNKRGNTPLHVACLRGDPDTVRALTSIKGCNVNLQNKGGNTPLHVACLTVKLFASQGGNFTVWSIPIARRMVRIIYDAQQHNPNATIANKHNETAIHVAFREHHSDMVKLIITKRRENLILLLKCTTQTEWPSIVDILSYRNVPSMPIFQSYIQVLKFLQSHQLWSLTDEYENNDLHAACSVGDIDLVKSLVIELGNDLNKGNNSGDTPLHLACRLRRMDIVEFLVVEQKCEVNSLNISGNTPLHEACMHGAVKVVELLSEHVCTVNDGDIVPKINYQRMNQPNKEGNSPLHLACLSRALSIVKILISKKECNYNPQNAHHETPAIIAFNHDHRDILRSLITEQHCECLLSLLHATGKSKWADIIHILTDLKTLNDFQHPLEVITFLVQQKWDLNRPDRYGNTALHFACNTDLVELLKFLITDQCCSLIFQNSDGDTPLHIACKQGNLDAVRHILNGCTGTSESTCKFDVPNNQGDTPLHCACSIGHVQIIKMLLSSDLFDPTSYNTTGLTPIELTTEYQVISELSIYAKFRASQPIWSNIKVCVIGDHATGKTTLVEVLSRQATRFWKVVPSRFRRVTNTEHCTAGIILVRLQSKKFGNVILYDFAGHKEYYSSHAAVLENFKSKSPPPLFVILLKLTESMKYISEKLYYWTSMIENHCKLKARSPQVLVVGSFADEVKAKGGSVRQVSDQVQKIIKSFRVANPASDVVTSSLEFVGFVPLDCRVQASGRMDEFSDSLAKTCQRLQETADTSFGCHILYTLLLDKFREKVACTVAEIMESVQREDILALHNDTTSLVHLLKSLSDFGEIILLANQEKPTQGWVILNSKALLSEINATVFAPEHFKWYKKGFAMSTGVVPLSKIEEVFPNYDSEMITQFLTHLEFCQEIKDLSVLPDIMRTHQVLSTSAACGHTPAESNGREKYFFFPSLVSLEKNDDVWENSEESLYKCGWLLQCIRPGKFLTTRFLHVLLLRLAFAFGLNPQPHESSEDDLVLRKRCSVWKSGIQWLSRAGIETIVEVREQTKVVVILMRCPKDKEVDCECAELRSSVIGKILSIQQEFCPAVTPMMESLIHPKDVQYPLKNGREMKIFSVNEIAQLVIENKPFAIESLQRGMIYMEDLLLFEPYLGLGVEIVKQLFSTECENKEVTERFLSNKLASQTFKRLSMYKKMINPNEARYAELCEQAPFNQVKQCFYLFQLWSERESATFKALRQLFDRYSIFLGRNPLVRST